MKNLKLLCGGFLILVGMVLCSCDGNFFNPNYPVLNRYPAVFQGKQVVFEENVTERFTFYQDGSLWYLATLDKNGSTFFDFKDTYTGDPLADGPISVTVQNNLVSPPKSQTMNGGIENGVLKLGTVSYYRK